MSEKNKGKRHSETDRETERPRGRWRETERATERATERQRERQRDRDTERHRETQRETETESMSCLWGDATPEVGVERARLHHGCHQCEVLRHHQVQHLRVDQEVVTVRKLGKDNKVNTENRSLPIRHF